MIDRIKNKLTHALEMVKFKIFSNILKKYDVQFFYKDSMGVLTKRKYNDNFRYIFKTKNSCDAVPMMKALNERIINAEISIDVGANIGVTSIWMAKNSKIVYAFEPDKANIERLKENLSANYIDNVELIQKAVSDKDGEAELYLYNSYGHHSLSPEHVTNPIGKKIVGVISLDNFCQEKHITRIDFLKIDVEGYEYDVLKGAANLLKDKAIKLIAFEHSAVLFNKQNKSNNMVINYLRDNEFRIYHLNGEELDHLKISELWQEDLYAISKNN